MIHHIVSVRRCGTEGTGLSADASGFARRKLALRLGTLPLTRRLGADSWRSPHRAIGPAVVIHAFGSTWWEVDAEGSLRTSFGCARHRRSSQVGVSRHAGALCGPAVCRVTAAYARPTPTASGNRAERRAPQRASVRAGDPAQSARLPPSAFELWRLSSNVLSRELDVASNQHLDARTASGYERGPISRPQHPRP
jgi:hypothetical protein